MFLSPVSKRHIYRDRFQGWKWGLRDLGGRDSNVLKLDGGSGRTIPKLYSNLLNCTLKTGWCYDIRPGEDYKKHMHSLMTGETN